jgi:hypothetical protein
LANLRSSLRFFLPQLSSSSRIFIAPLIFFTFWDQWWDPFAFAMFVHGNKCQVRGCNMPGISRNVVFHPALYPDFHRCIESAVDGRFQDQQIAYLHRQAEIDVIH